MEHTENANKADGAPSALNAELGLPLSIVDDVEQLLQLVEFLYDLLDDIDTASDIAKYDDKLYRQIVERTHAKRHEKITSDGSDLFVVPNVEVRRG